MISNNKLRDIIIGIAGGFMLFIPLDLAGYIPFIPDADGVQSKLFYACIVLSGLIAFLSVSYKYVSIKRSVFRSAVMLISILLAFIISVQFNLTAYIDTLLNIQRDSEDMAPGLMMVFVLYSILLVIVVANIVVPLWTVLRNKIKNNHIKAE